MLTTIGKLATTVMATAGTPEQCLPRHELQGHWQLKELQSTATEGPTAPQETPGHQRMSTVGTPKQ
jgi:hypothetical protein